MLHTHAPSVNRSTTRRCGQRAGATARCPAHPIRQRGAAVRCDRNVVWPLSVMISTATKRPVACVEKWPAAAGCADRSTGSKGHLPQQFSDQLVARQVAWVHSSLRQGKVGRGRCAHPGTEGPRMGCTPPAGGKGARGCRWTCMRKTPHPLLPAQPGRAAGCLGLHGEVQGQGRNKAASVTRSAVGLRVRPVPPSSTPMAAALGLQTTVLTGFSFKG
jgi:hypothetical protein